MEGKIDDPRMRTDAPGCGGRSPVATLVVALLAAILGACGKEPDLSTPESAARGFCEKLVEQVRNMASDVVAVEGFEIECDLKELSWYSDPSERRRLIERKKARHDFEKSHLSELLERKVEIVEVSDAPNGGKKVIVRIVGKQGKEKKGAVGEWEMVDDDEKMTLVLTQADGKWRVKER